MTFDPTKPVQTRDGCKARIICTDKGGDYPIVALVPSTNGKDRIITFNKQGKNTTGLSQTKYDLVNIPDHAEPSLHQCQIKVLQRQFSHLEMLMLELPEMQRQARTRINYYVALKNRIKEFLDDNG